MVIGVVILFAAVAIIAIAGPLLDSLLGLADYRVSSLAPFEAPSPGHLFGADYLGRDVTARVLHGGGGLLATAVLATAATEIAALVATGLLVGRQRIVSAVIRIALDALVVVPPIVILLVVVPLGAGGTLTTALGVAALSIPFSVRYLHAAIHSIVHSEYAEIAILEGDSPVRVYLRQILPNALSPLLADSGIRFVTALFLVSTAQFLGASTGGSTNDWASMVQLNYPGIEQNPWAVAIPCAMLGSLAMSATLLADRLAGRLK